ncbi:hypothetical protein VFPPC_18081 [Pochonia chlamydosporia 170]|uniref:Uncharacterized protein n=1 Tax=Pochonia chlamydosporia 170 TaxID=1380566 RepID=A0A219APB0_METCM|nr:hypothetical protein VFPPC_18081 [Pochonia chlamydosporia 170]OWT42668.1 hypothetical protein VFPPC_18081 [Pochonia chlamydosporia 170]
MIFIKRRLHALAACRPAASGSSAERDEHQLIQCLATHYPQLGGLWQQLAAWPKLSMSTTRREHEEVWNNSCMGLIPK